MHFKVKQISLTIHTPGSCHLFHLHRHSITHVEVPDTQPRLPIQHKKHGGATATPSYSLYGTAVGGVGPRDERGLDVYVVQTQATILTPYLQIIWEMLVTGRVTEDIDLLSLVLCLWTGIFSYHFYFIPTPSPPPAPPASRGEAK